MRRWGEGRDLFDDISMRQGERVDTRLFMRSDNEGVL